MQNRKSFIRSLLLILLVLAVGLGTGFFAGTSYEAKNEPNLRLNVTMDEEAAFKKFTKEDLGGNFDELTYFELSDVSIQIGRKTMKLEDAIRDGHVTVEQIVAQAQEDARNKDCFLYYDKIRGLTIFRYSYRDQYDIRVIYDVFECSDGEKYHLNNVIITAPRRSADIFTNLRSIVVDDSGEPIDLLREDWGLEFTAEEASPTDITINYSQWGGMAVGDLSVKWIHIYDSSDTMVDSTLSWTQDPIPITANTFQGEMHIDWEDYCGALPAGEYTLLLYIEDVFSEGEIHPLIRKYCDNQYFPVSFTVE